MSGLIPFDEMTELKPASEVKAIADSAVSIIEQETVAAAINQAANTGGHAITYSKPISNELVKTLQAQGYNVTKNSRAANPDCSWIIKF